VGGYTHVLHEHALLAEGATRDVMPWIFPVEFRPINPIRGMRKWVLQNKRFIHRWLLPMLCVNIVSFVISTLLAATSSVYAAHPALIAHVCISLTLSFASLLLIGATVSDRSIFRYLAFKFEVWLTLYQVGGTCAARACKRAGPFPPFTKGASR
jgi:hypothetical protein